MKDTLGTIQKIYKFAYIISKIVLICSIVVACISLVGAICLVAGLDGLLFTIGDINIKSIIDEPGSSMAVGEAYGVILTGMLSAIAQAVVSWFAAKYFKRELEAGTPFTLDGAMELRRLGIIAIAAPIIGQIGAGIVAGVIQLLYEGAGSMEFGTESSVTMGVLFIVMSLFLRYGAELRGEPQKME